MTAACAMLLFNVGCGASDTRHKILNGAENMELSESAIVDKLRSGELRDTTFVWRGTQWVMFMNDAEMQQLMARAASEATSSASAPAPSAPSPSPAEQGDKISMTYVPKDFPLGLSASEGGGSPLFDVPDVSITKLPPPPGGKRLQGTISIDGMSLWTILDEGAPPRLYIDMNGNSDLTDDPGPFTGEREGVLPNHYTIPIGAKKRGYRMWAFASRTGGMKYYAAGHWVGTLQGNNGLTAVLFDANADFDYSNDGIAVDLNGDGSCGEGELFKAGDQFASSGIAYTVVLISPDGAEIMVRAR